MIKWKDVKDVNWGDVCFAIIGLSIGLLIAVICVTLAVAFPIGILINMFGSDCVCSAQWCAEQYYQ